MIKEGFHMNIVNPETRPEVYYNKVCKVNMRKAGLVVF
jgi:hypothetical protein